MKASSHLRLFSALAAGGCSSTAAFSSAPRSNPSSLPESREDESSSDPESHRLRRRLVEAAVGRRSPLRASLARSPKPRPKEPISALWGRSRRSRVEEGGPEARSRPRTAHHLAAVEHGQLGPHAWAAALATVVLPVPGAVQSTPVVVIMQSFTRAIFSHKRWK